MQTNKTEIKLHGNLGKAVGSYYKLAVGSVSEAIHAINIISKRKLYKFLSDNDKKGLKYRVLINGLDFSSEEPVSLEKPESILKSELIMKLAPKTIDIIPVTEGAGGGIGATIAGALLIIVGIVLAFTPFAVASPYLIVAGIGLLAAGIISLISKPPDFPSFQPPENGGGISYLFNGPENITKEGGPVPVGYGRLIIGSLVISASYDISNRDAFTPLLTQ